MAIHYSGAWYSQYLPINNANTYDNTGHVYNVSRIIGPDFTLDEQKYKEYSPLFMPSTLVLQFGLSFATIVNRLYSPVSSFPHFVG